MKRHRKRTVLALIVLSWISLGSIAAVAQNGPPQPAPSMGLTDAETAPVSPIANIPAPIPDSPAFDILGLAPKNVSSPVTGKDLFASLINGVDSHGNLQGGLALEIRPGYFVGNIGAKEYRENDTARAINNIALSLATTKGATDNDKSARAALGARLTLFNGGDPKLDDVFLGCLKRDVLDKIYVANPSSITIPNGVDQTQYQLDYIQNNIVKPTLPAYDTCRTNALARDWNYSAAWMGFAGSAISPSGNTGSFRSGTLGVYGAFALGFDAQGIKWSAHEDFLAGYDRHGAGGQLIFSAKYLDRDFTPDPNNKGKFITQNTTTLATMIRYSGSGDFVWYAEPSYTFGTASTRRDIHSGRLTLGLEWRVADALWLDVSLGGNGGSERNGFVLGQLKYSLDDDPNRQKTKLGSLVPQ